MKKNRLRSGVAERCRAKKAVEAKARAAFPGLRGVRLVTLLLGLATLPLGKQPFLSAKGPLVCPFSCNTP